MIYLPLLAYLLFVFFAAVMALRRVRDDGRLTTALKVLGYPTLFIGYSIDFLSNVLIMTVILFEIPKETTVTARVKRHIKLSEEGYRSKVCAWICQNILTPIDPKHCQ